MLNRAVLAATLTLSLSGHAFAHALMMNKDAKPGAWHLVEIGIPHGCAGQPTTSVKIKIPDGIVNARPQVKPGWKLAMTMRKLETPIAAEGVNLTEVADEVTWTGGSLADMEFDKFAVLVKLPSEPGRTVYFKTIQDCGGKAQHRWIEIPEGGKRWGEYKEPAPFVQLSDEPVRRPAPAQQQ